MYNICLIIVLYESNMNCKRHSIFDVRSLISFLIYLEGDFDHDSHIRSNSNKIIVVLLSDKIAYLSYCVVATRSLCHSSHEYEHNGAIISLQ